MVTGGLGVAHDDHRLLVRSASTEQATYVVPPQPGIELIKHFEGVKDGDQRLPGFQPYRDHIGLWTIGYGHLLSPDPAIPRPDVSMTIEECENTLQRDALGAYSRMRKLIVVSLNVNEASALMSFVFNLGSGALKASALRQALNRGERQEAADQFLRWIYAGGQPSKGLLRRRQAERQLFLS